MPRACANVNKQLEMVGGRSMTKTDVTSFPDAATRTGDSSSVTVNWKKPIILIVTAENWRNAINIGSEQHSAHGQLVEMNFALVFRRCSKSCQMNCLSDANG